MLDSVKNVIGIVVMILVLALCTGTGTYVGWKCGSWYGYVKGVTHRILPWKREDGGRRRILPRPFNPGDAPAGAPVGALQPTEEEYEVLDGVFQGFYHELEEENENN